MGAPRLGVGSIHHRPIKAKSTKPVPLLGVKGVIVAVIASTILGFIMAILIAMNYNTISKLIGGLEIEIE